jgi:hypothetical protein
MWNPDLDKMLRRRLAAADLVVAPLEGAPQGADPHCPRVEDLPPPEATWSPLAWAVCVQVALPRFVADGAELGAVVRELAAGGALYELAESRRDPRARRRLPVQVAEDLVRFHREWSERAWSDSIARAYPEAQPPRGLRLGPIEVSA